MVSLLLNWKRFFLDSLDGDGCQCYGVGDDDIHILPTIADSTPPNPNKSK